MKVAYVNQPLDSIVPPHQNSIGIWTYRTAPFVGETAAVRVYGRRTAYQKRWDRQPNVVYTFYPTIPQKILSRLSRLYTIGGRGKLPPYATKLYSCEYILQVARDIRKHRCDIVHIHNFTQFVPFIRKTNPGAKIVLHMNGEWLSQLDYAVMDTRIAQTDLVLGSSDHITNLVKGRFPHHSQRCKTIYNGVDASLFKPERRPPQTNGDSSPHILFVGRVSPEKGVHDLIKAFLIVLESNPEAKLDIVGPVGAMPLSFLVGVSDDPLVASLSEWYRADYHSLLVDLIPQKFAQNINFHGGVSQEELVSFYHRADVLVNPSYSESFGMSLVEAMACEKPVVATRVGGMVEIVERGNLGTMVERGDIQALVAGINQLLADGECRDRLGKNGRERVLELFDWPQVARKAVGYYHGLLANA